MADGLLNKASIILTPTGYKAGTLYNVAPVVEPYEDFDFARASTATRINSSGLVEMVGRTLGSELMPSVATIVNVGGGSITQISSNSYSSTSNGTTGSSLRPKFDFNTTSGKTYKLVITPTGTITGTVNFDFYDGSSYLFQNYDFTTTKEIYFTDNGSVFGGFDGTKTYSIASFTISVKEVIDTNNIPRISYDSNGDNGHILLEPTSTNLITYSEDFTDSSWTKSNVTITSNSIISPDGSLNASLMTISGGASDQRISSNISYSGTNTVSIFAKASNSNWLSIRIGSSVNKWYDLENGVLGGSTITTAYVDADIQDFGNGWYRCILVFTDNDTLNTRIYPAENNLDVTHTSGSVYIWGCQAEALPYATSYIPTLTGSTETRATETATGAGSADLINSTEGVLYAEIAALANSGGNRRISISDGSDTNRLNLFYTATTNEIKANYRVSNSTVVTIDTTDFDITSFNKIAFRWQSGNFVLFINGQDKGTNSNTTMISANTLNVLRFEDPNLVNEFYGKCKALAVFDEALSDSELTQLTT